MRKRNPGEKGKTLEFSSEWTGNPEPIAALFTATFTASEGPAEGALIGALAHRLITTTPSRDLRVVCARQDGVLVGAIVLSRLAYDNDNRLVFLLAPVAVSAEWQGKMVGQSLIAHGIEVLRREGVEIVVTYGDPKFYRRVGFVPIRQADVPAPFDLQHPEGWQGRSLNGAPLLLKGPARCVEAFNDPTFW